MEKRLEKEDNRDGQEDDEEERKTEMNKREKKINWGKKESHLRKWKGVMWEDIGTGADWSMCVWMWVHCVCIGFPAVCICL